LSPKIGLDAFRASTSGSLVAGHAEADDLDAAERLIAARLTERSEAGEPGVREDFSVVLNDPDAEEVEVVLLGTPGGVANIRVEGKVIGSVMRVEEDFVGTAYPPLPADEWTIGGFSTLDEAIDAVVEMKGVVRLSNRDDRAVAELEAAPPGTRFRTIRGARIEVGDDGSYWVANDGTKINLGSAAAARTR
jgi:hypothetical protein